MQWLQDQKQSNVNNLNNVRCEDSRHFKNKNNEYVKAKVVVLETYRKLKNIRDLYRDISDLKKGYQTITNIVKNEKGDLVTDCHSIWARCEEGFSQFFNEHDISDLRQRDRYTYSRTTSARDECF